jgi:hypothetical protein
MPTPASNLATKSATTPETQQRSAIAAELISRSQLEFLSREHHQACVSIFLPMHRSFPEIKQDPIRLKDLLRQAESALSDSGIRPVKVRELLAPARHLVDRDGFWSGADGLAIFLTGSFFHYYRLPIAFEELVTVTDRFEISPLLPLFAAGGRFYILALSRNLVRLIEATPYGWAELELPNLPRSEQEALKYDVRQPVFQVHSGAGGPALGRKKEGSVFTGQGGGVDDEQTRTLEFVYAIERGLRRRLREDEPLVLAAVEELQATYRKINRHRGLLEHGLRGNPDRLSSGELHKAALEFARDHFEEEKRQAIAAYTGLRGVGRSSKDLHDILQAAHQGRVQAAFIEAGMHIWGDFDFDGDALQLHDDRQRADEDLLNIIAVQTILHRGAAYQLPRQSMPDESFVAASFRY